MTQPTALRLAVLGSFRGGLTLGEVQEAEDELNRLVAQRDALLEALKGMRHKYGEYACSVCDQADAAIKAVEEGK